MWVWQWAVGGAMGSLDWGWEILLPRGQKSGINTIKSIKSISSGIKYFLRVLFFFLSLGESH